MVLLLLLSSTASVSCENEIWFCDKLYSCREKERNEVFGFQPNSTYLVNCYNFLAGMWSENFFFSIGFLVGLVIEELL